MIEGVSERRDIVILGSTGSVGTQALDVVRANPDRFRVVGLTAGGSQEELFEQQVAEFAPAYSGLGEDASTEAAGHGVRRGAQRDHRRGRAAADAGCARRRQHARAGQQGVADHRRPGGHSRARSPARSCPVDSEHSALAQCLRGGRADEVRRLVLTASGGPFRGPHPRRAGRGHAGARRWPTRPGTWARSSRSTPRPWSTRASR